MKNTKKLTPEDFILRAIETLAKDGRATIHTVYSGMNQAFREYFPGLDPIQETDKLAKAGKISFRLARGGAIIGKPGAISSQTSPGEALKKMGLGE